MADPLSVGASVVGLISVAAHVSSKLLEFVGDSNDAPALARHVMSEIYAIKAAITTLQTYLWGETHATSSQESMVLVEHLAVILTACVFTFNELETEVSALRSNFNMKTLERVKWARKKGIIAQLFARLQNHKLSLSLILDILQSQTNAHAERSLRNLYAAVNDTLNFQREIADRLERLETGMGPVRSIPTVRENDLDTNSLYSLQSTTSQRTARAIVSKFRFSFDTALETSRVYRRSNFRYPVSPESSGTSSIAARSMGWSFMSGLSIADISQVSTLSLPIYPLDIPNSKFYTFDGKTQRPAASSGNKKAVQVLPKISSSTNVVDPEDSRVKKLHSAARHGRIDEIQLLINDGVNISAILGGKTALHLATENGHKDTVELLLSKGADISAVDEKGWTALHIASFNGHKDTVELLLSKGADISAVDEEGWTALHSTSRNGHKDTVELLLSKGADISAVDEDGWTALHSASYNGHKDTVELLLSKGADISAVNEKGWTALISASRNGHKDTVELLLSKGADISAVQKEGLTALHFASFNGHKDTVELLLESGAGTSAVTKLGNTALDLALMGKHIDIAEMIRSYPKKKVLSIQDSAKVPSTGDSETLPKIALEGQSLTTELSTLVDELD